VLAAREALAQLFHVADPSRIVFTQNATEALNLAIYGLLQPGDHVITSSMEHNAVARPLRHLEARGVAVTFVPCSPEGLLDPADVRQAIRPNTRLLVTAHGSNVVGTLQPLAELATLARTWEIPYLVDAAQTAGAVPIDVTALGIDLLAFTGHKGLLGLTGTGGLYIREGVPVAPLMRGGTGSDSALETQPCFLPDAYESGTRNVVGLAGLTAGVEQLLATGIEQIQRHEQALTAYFLDGAAEIPGLTLYGPADKTQRTGVVSFNVAGLSPAEVGYFLEQEAEVMCRAGLHCAPAAHRTIGTYPAGTVRFSWGSANSLDEIDVVLDLLTELCKQTHVWAGMELVHG
jgi:cysteine desulfurase family protein